MTTLLYCGTRRDALPHQHFAVFIRSQLSRVDDFRFQILDRVIVQLKLTFKQAMRHAPLALQALTDLRDAGNG